jgi:hypothetical protein
MHATSSGTHGGFFGMHAALNGIVETFCGTVGTSRAIDAPFWCIDGAFFVTRAALSGNDAPSSGTRAASSRNAGAFFAVVVARSGSDDAFFVTRIA